MMRFFRWISILAALFIMLQGAGAHGDPSVAALVSSDPGEPFTARINLDLAVFFKGRVAPDGKWVSQQSAEDLELLRGDLDAFLRARYDFSVEGDYTFPMLGSDIEVEREIAPGIALPDGHVMPVFTSEKPPELAVAITASDEAVPLVVVREIEGKRDRRAVILFPGEEREVFAAKVVEVEEPVVVEGEIDSALFNVDIGEFEFTPWEQVRMGWERALSRNCWLYWMILLAIGFWVRSTREFWVATGIIVLAFALSVFGHSLYGRSWLGLAISVGTFVVPLLVFQVWNMRRKMAYIFVGAVVFGREFSKFFDDEGVSERFATGAGGLCALLFVALVVQALVGWMWKKEKTPRALALWGWGVFLTGLISYFIWPSQLS